MDHTDLSDTEAVAHVIVLVDRVGKQSLWKDKIFLSAFVSPLRCCHTLGKYSSSVEAQPCGP